MEIGERVALNRETVDTEGDPVSVNEVGMVIGHMGPGAHGQTEVVSMDHGLASNGGTRVVLCPSTWLRVVRVSRPGAPRRTKPRRVK